MGWLSNIFKFNRSSPGVVSGRDPGKGWTEANRYMRARGGYAGGYGAWTFGNIMNAHSSSDEIVDEFELDSEYCGYVHPHYKRTPYGQAYAECYAEAAAEAAILNCDPEDCMDWEQVEDLAYDYALELAELYIDGKTWIPYEILEWAYYDVSDHNN